jgi:hypothetical protein
MSWQKGVPLAYSISRRRASFLVTLAAITAAIAAPTASVSAAPLSTPRTTSVTSDSTSQASAVVNAAKSHLGASFVMGATGPNTFDCSGLVYRSFVEANLLSKIGGSRRSAAGYYSWFRDRGMTSRSNGRVGDLVVYGYSGYASHMGIYLGNGQVISALTSGVRIHGLTAVTKPWITFLHTQLSGTSGTASAPAPAPTPPPATSGSHVLSVYPGVHYTYSVSGSLITGKRKLTIYGSYPARYTTAGIGVYAWASGTRISLVRLLSGPFAGRYMRPYETGNHLS